MQGDIGPGQKPGVAKTLTGEPECEIVHEIAAEQDGIACGETLAVGKQRIAAGLARELRSPRLVIVLEIATPEDRMLSVAGDVPIQPRGVGVVAAVRVVGEAVAFCIKTISKC